MAKRFLRHARAKSEWNGPAARSAEVQAAAAIDPEPAKRAPARKDTRSWCHGKPGRDHVPGLVMRPQPFYTGVPGGECGWVPDWSRREHAWAGARWSCRHEERCEDCGKVLRTTLVQGECPAYPGSLEQRTHAEAEAVCMQRRREEWHRRPVIDGPQGYRRKRQEAS